MDYITFATTGNGTSFGTLGTGRYEIGGQISSNHGGIA